MVLQMGLTGGGCISLCILGRKYMFPAFGESTNNRSARSSAITLLITAFPMASATSRTNFSVQLYIYI